MAIIPLKARVFVRFLLTIAVSLPFAYVFLRGLELRDVADELERANYAFVPVALALFAISLVLRACRWQVFYKPDAIPLRILFPTLLIAYAGNNLLPLRGGEILRAQILLDWAGLSRLRTLGTALVERLLDFFVVGVFVVLGSVVTDIGPFFLGLGVFLVIASIAGFLAGWYLAQDRWVTRLLAMKPGRSLPDSLRAKLEGYGESFASGFAVLHSGRWFTAVTGLTLAAWLLEFGMYWSLATAFSLDQGFLVIAFAGAAANVALSIPSAQGGVGPFQFAAKEALLRFGVPANLAAAYAVALHVLLVVPVSLVGLAVFWVALPKRTDLLKDALAGAPEPPEAATP